MVELIKNQCPKMTDILREKILIFGGSGSLGTEVINRWISDNKIMNVSRNEDKQWNLKMKIKNSNLEQMIGDISQENDVSNAILTYKPTIICIFACLKHIDLCEKNPEKSISINTNGIINVYKTLQKYENLHTVSRVLFVSTDKACLPITTYGCTKALSEFFIQGLPIGKTKWNCIRYGNVLNSSGSIIPYLKTNGPSDQPYTLTHPDMTRFIMTLQQSVNLIEYALEYGKHNEIIIPFIYSMKIIELFFIFEKKFKKEHIITGLRCKEKIHEDLISESEANQAYKKGSYYHITPVPLSNSEIIPFDSSHNIINYDKLLEYLEFENLLN